MLTILQLSDIHFKRLPEALEEYAQMRQRLYETVEDICKTVNIDCILICGDVAFSGNEEEYEQKAKPFVNAIMGKTNCQPAQVYMVPGNHDKDRNASFQSTRRLLRESLLKSNESIECFFSLYKEDSDVFKKWLTPFHAYINFASDFRCVSQGIDNVRFDKPKSYNDKFYWWDDLRVGKYILRLHGINSCYISDKDDDKHLQVLPKELYYTNKERDVLNVSVMHHPLEFVKDKDEIEESIDSMFPVQFYGHIHRQSVIKGQALKIFSGAIMPPKKESIGHEDYQPVFNLIEFVEDNEKVKVTVKPYKWHWTSKDDGRFEAGAHDNPHYIVVNTNNIIAEAGRRKVTLPQGVTQRRIEIEFLQSGRSDELIHKIYPDFVLGENVDADVSSFFEKIRNDNKYIELYKLIHN